MPDARRRPTAARPTAARRRRVPLPTWHGLRPPRLAAPAVMGPRTNPSPTACCAWHPSDRARIAPTRPACVLPARGAVPRRAYDRSAAHVPSYGHGGECDDTPRDALPRRRLRRAGVCAHPLRPSNAPPRTHSTPTRVACGDTWRCVAMRGARRACCTARQSTATRARHCAQGRQTRPSSPKARCRRAVAPDTHVCTRVARAATFPPRVVGAPAASRTLRAARDRREINGDATAQVHDAPRVRAGAGNAPSAGGDHEHIATCKLGLTSGTVTLLAGEALAALPI